MPGTSKQSRKRTHSTTDNDDESFEVIQIAKRRVKVSEETLAIKRERLEIEKEKLKLQAAAHEKYCDVMTHAQEAIALMCQFLAQNNLQGYAYD